nr:ring-h2 finger protein atl20 [Quercus suber]
MNNSNRDDNQVREGNLESTAAEEVNVQGNPNAPNGYVNGKGGDSGNFLAFTDNVAVMEGGIMEGHGLVDSVINEGVLNSSRESSLNVLELNHVGLFSNAPDGTSLAVDDIDYFDQLLYIKDPDGCLSRRFLNFNFTTMGSPFYYSLETNEYYDFYNCSNVRRLKTGEFGLVPCLSGHDF